MEIEKKAPFSPLIGLISGIIAVSSASLFIRLAQAEAPSIVIAASRMGIAALILLPFCIKRFCKEVHNMSGKSIALLFLSGTFLALHFAFWITSLEYTSVASSVVLVTTAPLWVALLSPVFLNEHLSKGILIGLAVSLIGGVIVGLSSECSLAALTLTCENIGTQFNGKAIIGDLMALAGAFLSAGYLIVGRKLNTKVSLRSYIFSVYSISAIVLLFIVLISGQKFAGYSNNTYLWLFALALIPQIIGHSSFNWALKYLSAAYVSIALLGEPIGTIILTMIFLGEKPTILEIVGGLFILGGIALATRSEKVQKVD